MNRPDPNEWANKKKAAVERAKQLRLERQQADPDAHTFKPQINDRPSYLEKYNSAKGDSLDKFANVVGRDPDDVMEQPLPGSRMNQPGLGVAPSGGVSSKYDSKKELENKAQFLQQYENSHKPKSQPLAYPTEVPKPKESAPVADDPFFTSLRDNYKPDKGRGWNNDTAVSGFGSPPDRPSEKVSRKPTSATKDKRVNEQIESISLPGKSDVVQARSRLSLLKSKIQRSAASASPIADNQGFGNESEHNLRSFSANDPRETGAFGAAPSQSTLAASGRARRPRNDVHPDEDEAMYGLPVKNSTEPRQQQQPSRGGMPPRYNNSHGFLDNEHTASGPSLSSGRKAAAQSMSGHDLKQQGRGAGGRPREEVPSQQYSYEDPPPSRPSRHPVAASPPSEYAAGVDPYDNGGGPQLECPDCGRKFNPIPYEKHIKICAKVFLQKRKVFDASKVRLADNPEALKLLKQAQKAEQIKSKKKPAGAVAEREITGGGAEGGTAKWKQQSEQFRNAMKAARQYNQAVESGGPLPPPVMSSVPDPSLIPCPHCGRRFNEKAAERHIPQCTNIKAKPKTLIRGTGGAGGNYDTISNKSKPVAAPPPSSSRNSAASVAVKPSSHSSSPASKSALSSSSRPGSNGSMSKPAPKPRR